MISCSPKGELSYRFPTLELSSSGYKDVISAVLVVQHS